VPGRLPDLARQGQRACWRPLGAFLAPWRSGSAGAVAMVGGDEPPAGVVRNRGGGGDPGRYRTPRCGRR
jgi:hypothetical protein